MPSHIDKTGHTKAFDYLVMNHWGSLLSRLTSIYIYVIAHEAREYDCKTNRHPQ